MKTINIKIEIFANYKLSAILDFLNKSFDEVFLLEILEAKRISIKKDMKHQPSVAEILHINGVNINYLIRRFNLKYATAIRYICENEKQGRALSLENYNKLCEDFKIKKLLSNTEGMDSQQRHIKNISFDISAKNQDKIEEILKEVYKMGFSKRVSLANKAVIESAILDFITKEETLLKNQPQIPQANKRLLFLLAQIEKNYQKAGKKH